MDIDIHSSSFNKFLDLAKEFIGPLVKPTIEEIGLLSKEKVASWRLKNQVNTLVKAKKICEEKGINPKSISVKVLTPLLDNIALEEEDYLQDKWAHLIANLLDTSKNIQNHVLPYILSQLSSNEFIFLEGQYSDQQRERNKLQKDVDAFRDEFKRSEESISRRILELDEFLKANDLSEEKRYDYIEERNSLSWEINNKRDELDLKSHKLRNPIELTLSNIQGVELINLIRLGLVRVEQRTVSTLSGSGFSRFFSPTGANSIEISSIDEYYFFSDLGIYLVELCTRVK